MIIGNLHIYAFSELENIFKKSFQYLFSELVPYFNPFSHTMELFAFFFLTCEMS